MGIVAIRVVSLLLSLAAQQQCKFSLDFIYACKRTYYRVMAPWRIIDSTAQHTDFTKYRLRDKINFLKPDDSFRVRNQTNDLLVGNQYLHRDMLSCCQWQKIVSKVSLESLITGHSSVIVYHFIRSIGLLGGGVSCIKRKATFQINPINLCS